MKTQDARVAELEARVARLEATVKRLKNELEAAIDDLEKRTILRTPGADACRVCAAERAGRKPSPPISKLEEYFCRAGHGERVIAQRSRRKKERMPLDWEDVLSLAR
jgi:hypothetical protein